jgi:TPR repeat protein
MTLIRSAGLRAATLAFGLAFFAMPVLAQDDITKLKDAANGGDAEAQCQLAEAYLLGELGLKQDDAEAARWAQKSADQGNADAEALLAGLYLDGVGVPQDEAKATLLIDRAMSQKNGMAFYVGAHMARGHTEVPDHDARANALLRTGAFLGNVQSMVSLGDVYAQGTGVKPDPMQAYVWFGVAALASGPQDIPPELADAFKTVTAKLTPDEQQSAQALIVRCVKSQLKDCGQPDLPDDLAK